MAKRGGKILFGFLFFVVLTGALAGGGAWYLTESRAEGYRATATLLVTPSDSGLGGPAPSGVATTPGALQNILGITPCATAIAPPDYATLFTTDEIANELRERLGVEMKLEAIRAAMEAETQVALQTRDNVVYRRTIALHFTAKTPELAERGANAWASIVHEDVLELYSNQQENRQGYMLKKISNLEADLNLFQDHELEILLSLEATVQSEQADVQQITNDLSAMEQALARDEAALSTLKSYISKAPVAVVLELSVKEADLEATLAGTRAERDYLAAQVAALTPESSEARKERVAIQRRLERVRADITRSTSQLRAVENALSSVSYSESYSENRIRIAALAVTPETPIGPHRYVLVGGAAALGAIIGMILYFGLLTLRVYARDLDRP